MSDLELKDVLTRFCEEEPVDPKCEALRKVIWEALLILECEEDFACKAWNAAEVLRKGLKECE